MPSESMAGSDGPGGEEDFDLLAASLRASSGDLSTFVAVLADKLERALPGRVKIERRAVRFLSRDRRVTGIELDLGDRRYLLAARGGVVETRLAKVVRGVVLKTEALPLEEWIDALARGLAVEAQASEQGRSALAELLEG